jgi:hypothetical protein
MTRLTTSQRLGLTNMNKNAQLGTLGARIDALEYGTVATPSVGSIAPMAAIKYSVTPVIGTATYVHAAVTLGTGTTTVTTAITNPDVPRIATIKGNATMSGNVVITGTDINDASATDTIALNNTSEVAGDVAFKTITQIVFPIKTNGSGDTVSVGIGNLIGLPIAVPDASVVLVKSFDGAADAGSVTVGATAKASFFTAAGTLNGTKILALTILV